MTDQGWVLSVEFSAEQEWVGKRPKVSRVTCVLTPGFPLFMGFTC